MPPKRRKPRNAATKPRVRPHASEFDTLGTLGYADALPNATGLAALPVEILHMIVDYIPAFPVPCKAISELPRDDASYLLCRERTLHSLIQVCRWLRRACLPMAWSSLDVVDNIWLQESIEEYDKIQATALVEELEIITVRNPILLSYVRTVNVGLSRYCFHSVYAEFARALSLMPNLETLQILDAPVETEKMSRALHQAMFKFTYPTVKTLTCILHLLDIAPHFPNVEHVTLLHARADPKADMDTYAQIVRWELMPLEWVSSGCWDKVKKLELTSEIYMTGVSHILYRDNLWRALPNIEELPFFFPVEDEDYDYVALKEKWMSHRNLRSILLEVVDLGPKTKTNPDTTIYTVARDVLQSRAHTAVRSIHSYRPNIIPIAYFRERGDLPIGMPGWLAQQRSEGNDCDPIQQICQNTVWYTKYPWMKLVESQILPGDEDHNTEWETAGQDEGHVAPLCAPEQDEKLMKRVQNLCVVLYSAV